MHYIKKNILSIILMVILIAVGAIFILLNPVLLINVFMYAIAGLLIIMAIGFMVSSQQYLGDDKTKLILQSLLLIALSLVLLFFPIYISRLIIGIIFLLIPVVELVYANNKLEQVKKDIWKYIVGFILIFSFEVVLKIVFVILGIFFIYVAGYLLYLLIIHKKDNQNIFVIIILKKFIRKEDNDTWQL